MNEMEKYLYNHGYVSEVKKCNRQSELSIERAECIANKYNSLVEEKDKEIDRLNDIIKNLDKMFEYYFLGNLKYDQYTVDTIYINYIELKKLK